MKVVCLPGDGIGPEVVGVAKTVLRALVPEVELEDHLLGGIAIKETGEPLPPQTLAACKEADAVLVGAAGLPEYDAADVRPEQGLIRLRRELDVYANLRPSRKGEIDFVIVRELVGGLYYGPRGVREDGTVFDTCEYHPSQIERVVRRAFELARDRTGHLTSVDKANVLDTSRLWRRVATEVAADYPEVRFDHMLVDNAGMQIVLGPEQFDVLVMDNAFGDILSDVAAGMTGGLGLAASASLGDGGPGLYEPVHGSAPDITGQGIANPAATLRSVALMLEHGFGLTAQARALDAAVEEALVTSPTRDLGGTATTTDFAEAVLALVAEPSAP
jgi:3-isopropylmalate dehydrogenase